MLDRSGLRERSDESLRNLEKETVDEEVSNLSAGESVTDRSYTRACRKTGKVVPASEESLWVVGNDADVGKDLVSARRFETEEVEDVVVSRAIVVWHAD